MALGFECGVENILQALALPAEGEYVIRGTYAVVNVGLKSPEGRFEDEFASGDFGFEAAEVYEQRVEGDQEATFADADYVHCPGFAAKPSGWR